ncbi:MAG TPA: hypothetical protein DF613_09850 [Lachnospiraceae bacterium]|nr:hypothetical protein [Lachnospiraceae bacterium]
MRRQIEITDRQADLLCEAADCIAVEYHKRAEDMKREAERTGLAELRRDLENMAHTWEMWAMDAEGVKDVLQGGAQA